MRATVRANNSANDQDSVKEFLKWSEQITVEFVQKKPSFSIWRLIRLHRRFLCDVSLGNFLRGYYSNMEIEIVKGSIGGERER